MRKIASLNFLLTVAFVEATPAPISIDDMIISARTENEKDYYSRYSKRLEKSKFQVDQPVIGILTMPFWKADMKPDSFPYTQFMWEHNANFIHYAGSWSVPIRYDISEEALNELLSQINGVFIPGGGLNLIESNGEHHPFYKTAKRIVQYSIAQKDQFNIEWPVFGICQGFQTIHHIINDDDRNTLHANRIYYESRSVNWAVEDPKKDTKMFKNFPRSLLNKLESENVAFHAHDWVIDIQTYEESQQLSSFFNILATDEFSGTKFVMAMEAKKYPISGVMFHPETQQLRVFGDDKNALRGRVNNDTTDAINFYFSYWVNESAKKNLNSHKFKDPAAALKTTLKNTPTSLTNIYSSQTLTFGFYS